MNFDSIEPCPNGTTMSNIPAKVETRAHQVRTRTEVLERKLESVRHIAKKFDGPRRVSCRPRIFRRSTLVRPGIVNMPIDGSRNASPNQSDDEDLDADEFSAAQANTGVATPTVAAKGSWYKKAWSKMVRKPTKKAGLSVLIGFVPGFGPVASFCMTYHKVYVPLKDLDIGKPAQKEFRRKIRKYMIQDLAAGIFFPVGGSIYTRFSQHNHKAVDYAAKLVRKHLDEYHRSYEDYVRKLHQEQQLMNIPLSELTPTQMLEYTMNLHAMAGSLSMPASAPVDVPPRLITRTADGRRIQARLREPLPNSDLVENGDDPEYVAMEDVSPAAAVQRDYVRREAIRNNLFAQQQRCEEIQAAKDAITGVGKSTCMFGPFKCVAEGCGNNCNPPRLPPGRLLQTFAVPAEDLIQAISVDRASESVIEAQQPSAASSINDARPMFSFSASNIRQLAVQSLSRATAARLRAATSPPMGPVATAMPLANPAAVRPYLTWTTAPHSNTQTPESETRIPATLSDLTQQEPDWASTTLVGTYSGSRVPYPRPPAPTSHLDSASKTGRSVSLSFGNPTSLRRRHARRHNIPPHLKQRLASRKSRLSVIQEMGEPASTPRRASFTLEAYETDGERQDLGNDNGIEESYDSDSEFEGIDLRGTLRRAESTIGSCFDGADSDRGSLHEESCNGALTPAGGALMVANPTLPDSNQPTVPNTSDLGFFRSCVPSSGLSITEEFGIRLQSPQARTPEFVLVPEERFASINPLIEASTNRFAERGAVEENGVLVFPESLTLLPHSRPQDVQSIQLENEMRLLREEFVRIRCEPPGVNATGSNTFQAQSQIRDTIEHQRVIEPLSFYGSRYGSSPSPSVTSLVDPVMLSASMTGASAPIAPRQHTPGFVSYRSCHLQALYQSYRHDAGAEEISRSTDGLPTYGELTSNASPAQMLIASPNVLAGDVPRSIQAQMEEEAARQQYFYRDFTTALYAMPPFDDEDGEFPESDYWIEGGSSEDEEDEEEVTGDDDVEGAFAYARLYQSGPVPDPQCIRDYQRHQRRIQRRLGLPVRPPSLTPEEMQDVTDFIRGYTE